MATNCIILLLTTLNYGYAQMQTVIASDSISTEKCPGGSDCTIQCGSDNTNWPYTGHCQDDTLICPQDPYECNVDCQGTNACLNANIHWPTIGFLSITAIDCIYDEACQYSKIHCPSDADCTLRCTHEDSCQASTIYCPTNGDCNVVCSELYSCESSIIYCPAAGNCDITCTGENACYSTDIRWSPHPYTNTLICDNYRLWGCPSKLSVPPTAAPTQATGNPTPDTLNPSNVPSKQPSVQPTMAPSTMTANPSNNPSKSPSNKPIMLVVIPGDDTTSPTKYGERGIVDETTSMPPDTPNDPQKNEGESNKESTFILVIIILVACLIACGIAFVIGFVKKRDTFKEDKASHRKLQNHQQNIVPGEDNDDDLGLEMAEVDATNTNTMKGLGEATTDGEDSEGLYDKVNSKVTNGITVQECVVPTQRDDSSDSDYDDMYNASNGETTRVGNQPHDASFDVNK
eukprot:103788_1